ncbi:hypothetical protein BJ684DRAFT_18359 [Piptocephalis cylindrospora]|uniref:Uncharacterized protein n=1 Tax=Piptocephalis cylindrospora TaxID=1907219 RepID=A0A4P9Y829_9FUNG|nr:hypothetical protein BJ684DRAFT_18359 [Piptocephalis cylindrospora]|eukprot:RKP15316.1 hypothetical protein BJ684DRAFT_18359 [Piptocephalis cylindrospora]
MPSPLALQYNVPHPFFNYSSYDLTIKPLKMMLYPIFSIGLLATLFSSALAAPHRYNDVKAKNYDNLVAFEEDMRDKLIAEGKYEAARPWHESSVHHNDLAHKYWAAS